MSQQIIEIQRAAAKIAETGALNQFDADFLGQLHTFLQTVEICVVRKERSMPTHEPDQQRA